MLATCVLVGAWSEPAKAAFPGTNGRRAFEGSRVFDVSPDGTKIAYSGSPSIVDIHEDIYVMARSGKGKKALTDTDDRSEWSPAWSPDGTKIAFLREQPFTRPDGSITNC